MTTNNAVTTRAGLGESILFTDAGHWPHDDTAWCLYFRQLDAVEDRTPTWRASTGTTYRDQLHHDWRCPIHGDDPVRAARRS